MTVAPFDYSEIIATADELLQEFGRQVTFRRFTTTAANPSKPWGAENQSLDTVLNNVWAAVVPFTSEDDPDAVRFEIKMIIVSASSFPSHDGETFDEMIDASGEVYHLHGVEIVNPGPVPVLYIFKGEQ